ncbi:MAG: 50S ribosomal protein L3 [Candidatus Woesearchaeota archaeon]
MPHGVRPRHGSMQFWPRKRAKRIYPRVRTIKPAEKDVLVTFAGYKAGMTHIIVTDNRKNALTKGEELFVPVTVIECPPLKIFSLRLYKKVGYGKNVVSEFFFKAAKEVSKKTFVPKKFSAKADLENIKAEEYDDATITVHTAPSKTGIGKKKPEIFELKLGGTIKDKIEFAKEHAEKEIRIGSVFKEGLFVDVHGITKGKGFQGPVKRFGVSIRQHKSEKTKRGPGSLGGWRAQGHVMWRVAHAGQTGFHQRTEYNKQIMKISDNASLVNPKGGFIRYGVVKNDFFLIKGSVHGPKKRLLIFTKATRSRIEKLEPPEINYISLDSKQGT